MQLEALHVYPAPVCVHVDPLARLFEQSPTLSALLMSEEASHGFAFFDIVSVLALIKAGVNVNTADCSGDTSR